MNRRISTLSVGRSTVRAVDRRRVQVTAEQVARRTPAQTAAAFWDRVIECGGQPAPDAAYVNNHTAVALICAAGHACSPRPIHVLQGKGICRRCAGQDPAAAAAAFWIRVAERGARPAPGAVYVNNQSRYR